MEQKNTIVSNALGYSGGATLTAPRHKRLIVVKEVENGWVVNIDNTGYASGEKVHIAKTAEEIIDIIKKFFEIL